MAVLDRYQVVPQARALRGTVLGGCLGLLPGGGPVLASFSTYALEKKLSKDPQPLRPWRHRRRRPGRRRRTMPRRRPPSSRCSPSACPSSAVMALMIGAHDDAGPPRPAPQVMNQRPDLFWA